MTDKIEWIDGRARIGGVDITLTECERQYWKHPDKPEYGYRAVATLGSLGMGFESEEDAKMDAEAKAKKLDAIVAKVFSEYHP